MHLQPVIMISAIAVVFYASIISISAQEFSGDAVPDRAKETTDKFEIAVSMRGE